MAQYRVVDYSVENILSWIDSREVAIPEMQRPFVWDSTKVRDLIDSLYQGFPVGYIIIWKNPDVKLKDGTTSTGKKIIIDGQQRITALTAALSAKQVVNKNYKKIRIKIAFNPIEEKFEVYNPAIGKDVNYIEDISEIFKPGFNTFNFAIEFSKKTNSDPSKISEVISKLQSVKNNKFGVIELDENLEIETVTDIFIRINSKGTNLSQADFVMSKISSNEESKGDIIRKAIDYFCHLNKRPMDIELIEKNDTEFSNLNEFNKIKWISKNLDDIYLPEYTDVIRVVFTSQFMKGRLSDLVSLLSGRNFETRTYEEEIVKETYSKLHAGVLKYVNQTNFERFIMILKSSGIIHSSLIRSKNVINFAYALFLLLRDRNYSADKIEKLIRKWLVLSMLTSRYSSSPESMFDYDIKRFDIENPYAHLESEEKGELSEAFWNYTLPTRLNTSVTSSPYFNVFLMTQIKSGDLGFLSTHISIQSMIENRGDVHHLFPKKYLQKNGKDARGIYNQIANYAYTQTEINITIKDKSPKEYMSLILKQIETQYTTLGGIKSYVELEDNFKQNCIPNNFLEYEIEDYDKFLQERRKLMSYKIKDYYNNL